MNRTTQKKTATKKKTPVKKKATPKKELTPEQSFLRAFLAFQSEAPELPRTEKVGNGNGNPYAYTPLPMMRKILQPYLTKYGFIYSWDFKEVNNKVECTCILTHIDGHSKTSTMTADKDNTVDMNSVQAVGSTMTYLQRYSFKAVLGLTSADDDDDGRSAGKKKEREVIPSPKPKSDGEHIKVVQEILQLKEQENDSTKT